MRNKLSFILAFLILTTVCWLTGTIFFGSMGLAESSAILIVVALVVGTLAPSTRKARHKVWIPTGIILLAGLFTPAPIFVKVFPIRDVVPFGAAMAFTLLLTISLALVVSAFTLNAGLHRYQGRQNPVAEDGGEIQEQPKNKDWTVVVAIALSILLLAKALHSFYWFMVWDTTTDSLGYIWLPIPVLAVLVSSFMLFIALPDRKMLGGGLYLFLIPLLIAVSALAQKVDFRQLTDQHAERLSQGVETYYTRKGRYPPDLRALTPWYVFPLPGPVIIYGEGWCFDAGEDHYRLGYIYRQHWSNPRLIGRIYTQRGSAPGLQPPCQAEVAALQNRYPDYPYEYWTGAK
jgi:hypothetical protein